MSGNAKMKRELLRQEVGALRSRWWQLSLASLGWWVATAAIVWAVAKSNSAGGAFVGGVMFCAWLFLLREFAQIRAHTFYRRVGVEAEEWTYSALHRLGDHWTIYKNVDRDWGDIDHVAFGPTQILAVETKWQGTTRTDKATGRPYIHAAALRQAQEHADHLKSLIEEAQGATIVPVIVLWGPSIPHVPGGWFRSREGDRWPREGMAHGRSDHRLVHHHDG